MSHQPPDQAASPALESIPRHENREIMPAPGDQYGDVKNPFESRSNDKFSSEDAAMIQRRLNKQLGPEYISQRPGNGGGKVAYLEGNKAIALANEMFGFDGWSSSLGQVQVDFVDENAQNGKVCLGLSIVVRITLKSGTFHEDIGYGSIENGKGKAASFEKAKKEAATDGLKRALRTFGNALGNCLYDKDYLKKVQAMKVKPVKFNEENLHRHPDFAPPARQEEPAPVKREAFQTPAKLNQTTRLQNENGSGPIVGEFDDEFDGNLFDGVEISENNGDDFTFEQSSLQTLEPANSATAHQGATVNSTSHTQNGKSQRPPNQRIQTAPSARANGGAPPIQHHPNGAPQHTSGRPQRNHQSSRVPQTPVLQQTASRPGLNKPRALPATIDIHAAPNHQNGPQQTNQQVQQPPQNQALRPTPPQAQQSKPGAQGTTTPAADPHPSISGHHVGFITSRVADRVQNADSASSITSLHPFNPHAESPIPKAQRTPGIDHTRSIPVKRGEVAAPPPPALIAPNLATTSTSDSNGSGGGFSRPGIVGAMPRGGGGNINFANPQQDMNRRIGMPGGGGSMSPSVNRSAYKPPMKRPPLQDVSNSNQRSDASFGEPEAKRLKTDAGAVSGTENANSTFVS
ncbi:hypothetical protein DM02DRAFT_622038 [Periconia macrospinosa]|uniref:RAD52 homolog n=1 Tax=Periconia macrospinosa TaxID=97972 RepID=A0A2V1EBU3_9PLEO|nr:hypothetical protein DM02DRAFT_622038 [Periconia macrospinosa]